MWEEKCLMKISIIKKDRLYTVLSFALLLVIWKIISVIVNSAIIIPSPEITLVSLFNLIKTRDFYYNPFFP